MYILTALLFGCTDPDVSTRAGVVAGEPATVSVVLRQGESPVTSVRSTSSVDDVIKHVHILIFDVGAGQPLKSLFKGTYTGSAMQVSTLSGESIVWAVINVGQNSLISEGDTFFDDVASLAEFQKKMVQIGQVIPASGQALPMASQIPGTVMISPGNNPTPVNIQVQRLTAKISLQVVLNLPATDKADLLSWEVVNTPGYSYVGPKATQDAVTDRPEASGDSNYFRTSPQPFNQVSQSGGSTMVPGAGFYMFENRKGAADVYVERDRALKAPARSTYINIKARYQNVSEVKNVTYRLYLGGNNTNDYNVKRNNHYTYTMTIKSLTQYSTNVGVGQMDSRVVLGDTIFVVDLAEPVLDAHYDWRPVRLRGFPGYSRVEIINDAGQVVDVNTSWLKISLNKTWPTQAEISGNPALAPVSHIDLMEYTPSQRSNTIYLYADEMFSGDVPIPDMRNLNLRFTYTKTNNPENLNNPDSCYTLFKTISQKPALTMGNMGIRPTDQVGNVVPGVGNVIAIERRDEFAMKLGFEGLAATPLGGMRWGFNGILKQPLNPIAFEFYRTNGLYNTLNLVYKSGMTLYNQNDPADLGTPAYSGAFDAIYNTYAARYAIEKNRDLNGNGVLDPEEIKWYLPSRAELILLWVGKKGSTAAANEQMTASYWSSSEDGTTGSIDLNFSNGGTGGEISKNFPDYARAVRKMTDPNPGMTKSPYVIAGTRKVTGLPATVSAGHPAHTQGVPYPLHGSEGNLNTVSPIFEVARQDCGVNGDVVTSGSALMEWYVAAGRVQNWDVYPNPPAGVATPATGCNAYWEGSQNDPERGVGMWRLPTQRELMIVWMLRKEFLYDGFTVLAGTRYWSAPNYYKQSWFTDFANGYTGVPNSGTGANFQYNVRCVRDVNP